LEEKAKMYGYEIMQKVKKTLKANCKLLRELYILVLRKSEVDDLLEFEIIL